MFSLLFKNFITKTLVSALMGIHWVLAVCMLLSAGVFELFLDDALVWKKSLTGLAHWENLWMACFYFSSGGALFLGVVVLICGCIISLFGIILNMWLRTGITILFTVAGFFIWQRIMGVPL